MTTFFLDSLFASAKAHWISQLKKPILLISEESSDLFADLTFFLKKPPLELLPEDSSLDLRGARLDAIRLWDSHKGVLLASTKALFDPIPLPEEIDQRSFEVGMAISPQAIASLLEEAGFQKSKSVQDKGQYAHRGAIVDFFPISLKEPYRLECSSKSLISIRSFDPSSQRSLQEVSSISFLNHSKPPCHSLFSILTEDTLLVINDPALVEERLLLLKESLSPLFKKVKETYLLFSTPFDQQISPSFLGKNFFSFDLCLHSFEATRLDHSYRPIEQLFSIEESAVEIHSSSFQGCSIHLLASSEREKRFFFDHFPDLPKHASIEEGYLSSGLFFEKELYLPYTEWSKKRKVHRHLWRMHHHGISSETHTFQPGELVVHLQNGIGRFVGFEKKINHQQEIDEFLVVEYQAKSLLYVPLSQAHLLTPYVAPKEEKPTLHALGSQKWIQARARAETAILGYAKELLERAAARTIQGGFRFPEDGEEMRAFEAEFPYQETEDQKKAIEDVKRDMQSGEAMDRLICGDVGYGKTEVALRAAAKAVLDGHKQVAFLVPTTLLAIQHFELFTERLRSFPVQVALVSSLGKKKEAKQILDEVKEGKVDILIGTHRLLSQDVAFQNLGLMIIDEEHRFGVRAKEWLKKMAVNVACLTLSATPIPRTLYFSLVELRKMSVINSPPSERLPVQIQVTERDDLLIQRALFREFSRGGQVYFLHNRIETIEEVQKWLSSLIPSIRISIVHGQMAPDSVEERFHQFKNRQIDLLIATTIIENGIDMPNANTIFVDHADSFGLADLYQLKGRVGRSDRTAYAYFLISKNKRLTEVSQERLQAMLEAPSYGGGLSIALKDLKIRGAGDLLGEKQSGHFLSIGFHLYCKLLKKTVHALRNHKPLVLEEMRLETSYPAKIPQSYLQEETLRLEIYQKIGQIDSLEEAKELFDEIKDRFGPLPEELLNLYLLTRLKLIGTNRKVSSMKITQNSVLLVYKGQSFSYPALKSLHQYEEWLGSLAIGRKVS